MERESWMKRDAKIVNHVGKFDVTTIKIDRLRNGARTEKLL